MTRKKSVEPNEINNEENRQKRNMSKKKPTKLNNFLTNPTH